MSKQQVRVSTGDITRDILALRGEEKMLDWQRYTARLMLTIFAGLMALAAFTGTAVLVLFPIQ
jgi:hypothetical protein